ncbi:hypothetical protein ABCH17_03850 [Chlamydia abortus]|uniref:hypothetical protein n=1 Tax=Chlamydia abortus TaxID=83555 RepID=UPI00029CD3B8|nr:hypothetical protein [Chlamydia abortus]EGK68984.1 hypothetical protein CAB1_0218 [Chlamydia abortus LLG]SFV97471.1 Uncharacterised protein [Chlamydia abortus]
MNTYLTGAIIFCCILLSTCMVTVFVLTISLLHRLNKIVKNISKITTILNFEAKILAPLLLGKKLIFGWLRKRNKHLPKDIEDFICEGSKSNWMGKICKGAKWAAVAMLVWCIFRKKD